jgi:Flp pilus assembly protein TadG
MATLRWRRDRRSRGQALAEFALVLPIFLLVLFGIIDGGRMIFSNNHLSEAAREGSRWGSVQGRSTTAAGRTTIVTETTSRIVGVPGVVVTVACERNEAPIANCRSGDVLIVTVQSDFQLVTPFLSNLIGDQTLTATSKVMVNQ